MLKTWPLPHTVCVCGGGGGQDVITIQTSTMLQYHVCRPPAVLAGGAVVTNAFYSHNACWCIRALNNNGNVQRRLIKCHKIEKIL